ncbi:MAG TPA: hypothetical protein VG965_05655 [Patescibacteria group bacterium]|nr:hypothetical protein [Patescibacteria group bacterium]
MKSKLLIIVPIIFLIVLFTSHRASSSPVTRWWRFQSIDTMKFSRDLSREKLNDPAFMATIDAQVKNIADLGATHVAIATPYDEEFYPMLEHWVAAARKYHLNVWFRGNFSGWEGWFNYSKITREQHMSMTKSFILKHPDIFENGDIFTACPECENGGPGDPRQTGDIDGFRQFMIDEYKVTKSAFHSIGKNVASNYDSMNGDVARAVMDHATTAAMDGVVTIDHYVSTPEKLTSDIKAISAESGGSIVLGEFGAPIPDINGDMTDEQQKQWVADAFSKLISTPELIGVNYWTNIGSTTSIWNDNGTARSVSEVIKTAYNPENASGVISDELGDGISNAYIIIGDKTYFTDKNGMFTVPIVGVSESARVEADNYFGTTISVKPSGKQTITLKREKEDIIFKLRKFFLGIK